MSEGEVDLFFEVYNCALQVVLLCSPCHYSVSSQSLILLYVGTLTKYIKLCGGVNRDYLLGHCLKMSSRKRNYSQLEGSYIHALRCNNSLDLIIVIRGQDNIYSCIL